MRVLVIVQGELGDRPAGPELRGWEIAGRLARRHEVTVAATVPAPTRGHGLPVVPRTRASLLAHARRSDVVIGPLLPPYVLCALAGRRVVRVADLYDPVELEVGTLAASRATRRSVARQQALRRLQLRWSDVVVSANARQRQRTVDDLAAVGRDPAAPAAPTGESGPRRAPPQSRSPGSRWGSAGEVTGPRLVTVPMGLPPVPATDPDDRPLRRRFDVPPDAPLVLWWGTVWRWLDAGTAIRAIDLLRRRRPDVRLVITAGPPPNRATDPLNGTAEARALADRLGLLGRHVLFLDEWVPYADRHRYLRDADVGITLHGDGPEATLAARARYADYVGAGLPSVLAEGDEFAGEMAAAGAARLVPAHDAAATAAALDALAGDPAGRARAAAACGELARRYRWEAVLEPLVREVEAAAGDARPRHGLGVWGDSGRFYAHRVVDVATPGA